MLQSKETFTVNSRACFKVNNGPQQLLTLLKYLVKNDKDDTDLLAAKQNR